MTPTIIFAVLLIGFVGVQSFVCPPCDKSLCKKPVCGEGQVEVGGFCSCCNECAKLLKAGEECFDSPILPTVQTTVCEEGFMCYKNKCTSVKDVIKMHSQ